MNGQLDDRHAHVVQVDLRGIYNRNIHALSEADCSEQVLANKQHLLVGAQELWGIPFQLGPEGQEPNVVLLKDEEITLPLPESLHAAQLVFVHAADFKASSTEADGIYKPMMGTPRLGETVSVYTLHYEDGTSFEVSIKRRYQISEFKTNWGENSFESVKHLKPAAIPEKSDEGPGHVVFPWGKTQIRTTFQGENAAMHHWLYALNNPTPEKAIQSITLRPEDGTVFLFGLTAMNASAHPLRWDARQTVVIRSEFPLDPYGDQANIRIDMGAVIAVSPVLQYDDQNWETTSPYFGHVVNPTPSSREWLVDFTAHPDACLYINHPLTGQISSIPISELSKHERTTLLERHTRPVKLRVIDSRTKQPVAAKVHLHGAFGQYYAPVNGHRIPNANWFEDYGVEHVNHVHYSVYMNGEAEYKLPKGELFIEVTKGLEIRPVRKRVIVDSDTTDITIELEHVLPWRQKGWVTADTHVHFLSPQTALLEGEAEGVNVVNLLTSQWGEMFSNLGDFDGKTTIGSIENGGSGEYLVRVGTENRQHILGHISLLGYEGSMILPLCTGGPDESGLGDPLEATLTQWARQCREQFGLAVLPHLPNPRAEGAAAIVLGEIDAVEMCSFGERGINPYSLSDWYRYLNCGYEVPAVAGTDKMSQETPVGKIRTYALIKDEPFTYQSWMEAVRKRLTFVSYGPMIDFLVHGYEMGSRFEMPATGGSVDIQWQVETVTIPITRIELVVNGELKECVTVDPSTGKYAGHWTLKVQESCWVALRIRGRYEGQAEMITAHTSAVFILVKGQRCFQAADAMTILEQIEGSTAYVKTLATRAEEQVFKQLLTSLHAAHRALHHRMHHHQVYHEHKGIDHHHHH